MSLYLSANKISQPVTAAVRYLGTVVEETQLNTTTDLVLEFMSGSRDKQARYSLRNLSKKDYSGQQWTPLETIDNSS